MAEAMPPSGVDPTLLRQLKIKTGSCKRVSKELVSYEKELEREQAKTDSMKEEQADPSDIKQQLCARCLRNRTLAEQEAVLAETKMMIPDCRRRLEGAVDGLTSVVVTSAGGVNNGVVCSQEECEDSEGMGSTEELVEAKQVLADAEAQLG
eukprot:scaffold1167_cov418-Prasinococcus_capsulatus_cf.AAC.21